MRRFKKLIEDFVVSVLGWLICEIMLVGAYLIGLWVARHLGWSGNHDMVGLLFVFAFVWVYEHQNLEGKYDRLRELLDRRGP